MQTVVLTTPIRSAIELSQSIAKSLAATDNNTVFQAAIDLQILADLIDCLPLDQAEYCFLYNRAKSTGELLDRDEFNAARYQLREINRRLCRWNAI